LAKSEDSTEKSISIKKRVEVARGIQIKKFQEYNFDLNADIEPKFVKKFCNISDSSQKILETAVDRLQLSARAYFKILKVARTIADLSNSQSIEESHILEALQYRDKIFGEN
jgi:magnesium chelatase family protein